MSTYVLFWNPAISSFRLEDYRSFLQARPHFYDLNWSIWEHQNVKIGDRFVMVRCKNKPVPGRLNKYGRQLWEPCADSSTGICMAGTFISLPYEGEDWSGKGRETYYADLQIGHMADPDKCIILSTEELTAAIPSFTWTGGASGRLLDDASAAKLNSMIESAVSAKDSYIWSPY